MGTQTTGVCRLCGIHTKLTFEHIPPKSAYNDRQRLFQTIQFLINGWKQEKFRSGLGRFSLCEACNNKTGKWYGSAFVDWARQGMEYLSKMERGVSVVLPFHIMPLNVVKQICVMSLAMSSPNRLSYHDDMRRFVLSPRDKQFPQKYQIFVYFNLHGQPRFASEMALHGNNHVITFVESEVALPPFGYCVTSGQSRAKENLAKNEGLCEITHFTRYSYNIWTRVGLQIPVLETHQPFPLDYRSESQIEEDFAQNQQIMKEMNSQS